MRTCGCPDLPYVVVTDPERHALWHELILPLTRADEVTLRAAYGRPSPPLWTYIDDQFEASRRGEKYVNRRRVSDTPAI